MASRKRTGPLAYAGYLCARLLLLVCRMLPARLSRALAGVLGGLGYLLDRRHRGLALESVRRAFPDRPEAECRRIVRRCYRHLCLCALEFARLASARREEVARLWALSAEQVALFDDLRARGEAVVFVTGHVGLWELCGLGYTARGYPLCSIARPLDNERLNTLVDGVRERFGQRILAKRGALVAALRALRQGVSVGMLLDQDAGKHGVFVPLFGRPASTLSTAAEIALRSGARLVCTTTWRDEPAGLFRVRLGRIIAVPRWEGPRGESYDAEVKRITAEYTAEIEAAVREHPEQWLWPHRRWKTRPPEEKQGEPSR